MRVKKGGKAILFAVELAEDGRGGLFDEGREVRSRGSFGGELDGWGI